MTIFSRIIFSFLALLLLYATPHAYAAYSTSARSAFLFAERDDWNNALAHAARSQDASVKKTIRWMYAASPNSNASFDEIARVIRDQDDWPDQKALHTRAEHALLREEKSAADVKRWFSDHDPVSGAGKLALAMARGDTGDLFREGWRDADLDESIESSIAEKFSGSLRETDHAARISRLLWEEKTKAAQRMLKYVGPDYRTLFEARMELQRNDWNGDSHAQHVPTSLRDDIGLQFDLLRWNFKHHNNGQAEHILADAPKTVPYPEKWWPIREKFVREALEYDQWKKALKLLQNHGQEEGKTLIEALWLHGWTVLEHQKDPRTAYKQFYALFNKAKFPVSKARAAYWAGVAATRNGNAEIANNWFEQAAEFPMTFYGQLAYARLHGDAPLRLPAPLHLSAAEKQKYSNRELPRVIAMLDALGQDKLAHKFTQHLVDSADDRRDAALAAWLGGSLGHMEDGVRAAKRALQNNLFVLESAFPTVHLPGGLGVERGLALAIARQESEFDKRALSPSGAMGLMQLLPGTAKETARKVGMKFTKERLYEPSYNLIIGSAYLGRLVERFNGSYVLAIAAYNAGPRNVRDWMEEMGDPGNSEESIIRWIENIPFEETRTYVQRVLENLQIYRQILAGTPVSLGLMEDLKR